MKTEFIQKHPGAQWFWHTIADNGRIVADGSEGYNRLDGAIHGFLVSHAEFSDMVDKDSVIELEDKLIRSEAIVEGSVQTTFELIHSKQVIETENTNTEKGYN